MKRLLIEQTQLCFLLLFLLFTNNFAQSNISKLHNGQKLDCIVCHECETPTKTNPCLASCPREDVQIITYKVEDAPDVFNINNIVVENDIYGIVNFTHKTHATMSEMEEGCITCHHYNPPGKIVKCNFCHEADRGKNNINIPDLKSAYHRQCMNCHSSWEENSDCESCHVLNQKYRPTNSTNKVEKTKKQIVKPKTKVYKTKSEKGEVVTFHHNDHTKLFGAKCADCHKNEGCKSCHNQKLDYKKKIDTINHNRCTQCHNTKNDKGCVKCHKSNESKPFNHFAKTCFNLGKYHAKVSCASCHKTSGKFRGLKSECQSCHTWDEETFDHTITGLQLNEDHLDLECTDCHENRNYRKPICTECHEENEGFIVPQKLPGKRIK